MNSKERMLKILNGIIPDRIAKGEVMYHPKIVDEALGLEPKKDYGNALAAYMYEDLKIEEFEKQLKFRKLIKNDFVSVFPTFSLSEEKKFDNKKVVKDIFGNTITIIENESKFDYAIKTPEDLENYKLPDISKFGFKNIELWSKNSDLPVLVQTDSSIFGIWFNLTGFENYMVWFYKEREKLVKFMKKYVEYNVELAKECFKHGGDIVLIADDVASNLGTFLRPDDMRKYFFPYLKWQVKELKKALGVPVVFHSDGDLNEIMDDFVDADVDALISLQSFCNMDIKYLKEKYGSKITLWGNIDLGRLLELGTPEQVKQVVKETIRVAAPGGRYVLSTDNSPALPSIPTKNILAMYEAGEEYGNYPIDYEVDTEFYRTFIKNWK
jgi:uroporphyrinogen decarboxylase